jgi:hypothetical protein
VIPALRIPVLCTAFVAFVAIGYAAMHGKSLNVAAGSTAGSTAPQTGAQPQTLFCGLWRTDGEFVSTAQIKNVLVTASLTVTPVIYMGDGTEYDLPVVKLDPGGISTLSISDSLNSAPSKIRAHMSEFGSMALTFASPSPLNIAAGIEMIDLPRSLIFVAPFQAIPHMNHAATPDGNGDRALEAVWWKHDSGVNAFLALSNASQDSKDVSVEITGSEGTAQNFKVTLPPKNTEMVDLEPIIAELPKAERNLGGIRVRSSAGMHEIRATAGLVNDSEGYSATVEFKPHNVSQAGPSPVSYASVGIMVGTPDPMMKFPKTTSFTAYAVLRNPTSRPLDAKPVLYLMAGSQMTRIVLPVQHLGAGEARQLPLAASLTNFSGMATLVISYVGRSHDLLIATGSVDQTATYVFQVAPDTAAESWAKNDPYWSVADGFDTMMTVFNSGDAPEDIVATLTYIGGSGHYWVPLHLMPGESQMLDVGQLIEMHQPDADGNFLPFDVKQGSARFAASQGPTHPVHIALASGVFNVQTATCGQGPCNICLTSVAALINPSPVLTTVGGSAQASFVLSMSDGTSLDKTTTARWTSGNTAVLTVAAGLVKGVTVGATSLTASVLAPSESEGEPDPECPASCPTGLQTGGGSGSTQIPTSLAIVPGTSSTTAGPCTLSGGGSGCGMSRAFTYQVLDQTGAVMQVGGLAVWDAITVTGANPLNLGKNFATTCPGGTGPCGPVTNGSGQFQELSLGICASACIVNKKCVTVGPTQATQVWHVGPTATIAQQIGYFCDHATVNGQ